MLYFGTFFLNFNQYLELFWGNFCFKKTCKDSRILSSFEVKNVKFRKIWQIVHLHVWHINYLDTFKKYFFNCLVFNFKWPSMHRLQCPIHNGTIKTFSMIKYEIYNHVKNFENWFFSNCMVSLKNTSAKILLLENAEKSS